MKSFRDYVNERGFYPDYEVEFEMSKDGNVLEKMYIEVETNLDRVLEEYLDDLDIPYNLRDEYDLDSMAIITPTSYKPSDKKSEKIFKEYLKKKNFKKEFETFIYKEVYYTDIENDDFTAYVDDMGKGEWDIDFI